MPELKFSELRFQPMTTVHRRARHNLALERSDTDDIADELAPLILGAIKESGTKLKANEIEEIKSRIKEGLRIDITDKLGMAAKVSGNVAGSITVDW